MQDIVEHLESVRQALTPGELREAVYHDVTGNEELFKQVRSNPKIRLTSDGKYEYKVMICGDCTFFPACASSAELILLSSLRCQSALATTVTCMLLE